MAIKVDNTLLDGEGDAYAKIDSPPEKASPILVAMLAETTERVLGHATCPEDIDLYLETTESIFRVRSVIALKLVHNCPGTAEKLFN